MNNLKFGILLLVSILFCVLGGYAIVITYYQSAIGDYGYTFGEGVNYSSLTMFSLFGLFIFSYASTFLNKPKKSLVWLMALAVVFTPIVYFGISPLSKEDRVYEEALKNYGSNFNFIGAATFTKIHQHPDYIQYKYQLDNFEKDKESRDAYVALLNERVAKYKKYLESQNKSLFTSSYYVFGSDYNTFLFRYKGLENETVQKELYEITKHGVVSYNDMMDFQTKFVNNYKTVAVKIEEIQPTTGTGTDVLIPTIPEDNKNINEGGEVMKTVEPDVLTKEKEK